MNDETLTIRIETSLKKRAEQTASRWDETLSQVVRRALREYVQQHAQGQVELKASRLRLIDEILTETVAATIADLDLKQKSASRKRPGTRTARLSEQDKSIVDEIAKIKIGEMVRDDVERARDKRKGLQPKPTRQRRA